MVHDKEREYASWKGKGKNKSAKRKGKAKDNYDNEDSGSEFDEVEEEEGEENELSEVEEDNDEDDGEGGLEDEEEDDEENHAVNGHCFTIRYRCLEKGRINAFSCVACIKNKVQCYSQALTKARGSFYNCGEKKLKCIYPVCFICIF